MTDIIILALSIAATCVVIRWSIRSTLREIATTDPETLDELRTW